jgi:hypothetical protein
MANFHHVQVTPLVDHRRCYWCALERTTVRATRLVSRTSNLTDRRYSDPACERHAMVWCRVASPAALGHAARRQAVLGDPAGVTAGRAASPRWWPSLIGATG